MIDGSARSHWAPTKCRERIHPLECGFIRLKRRRDASPRQTRWWGRVIFYVADVDALYDRALAAGYQPATAPRDAEWGERFFHLTDPDGHELSFARPLLPVSVQ